MQSLLWVMRKTVIFHLQTRQNKCMANEDQLNALPEYFRVMLDHAEDISQQTIVQWPENLEGELLNRVHGWQRIRAPKIVSASARVKKKDCPLCGLAESDSKAHGVLWEKYGGGEQNLDQVVKAAQDAGLAGVNPDIAKKHFQNHNYEQPAPLGRIPAEERVKIVNSIPDRKGRVPIILVALYRHRFLSRRQIVQLLIPGSKISQSDDKTVSRLLNKMRFKHAVYEFRLPGKAAQKFYALGAYGAAYVEQIEGDLVGKAGVTKLEQISPMKLQHDISASDVFITMRCQLHDMGGQLSIQDQPYAADMSPESWWAERNLSMAFRIPGGEKKIEPDGFATLIVNDGRHLQAHLPMWLEWDSGHKRDRTIQQLINYAVFSQSDAAFQRFPQTRADGYKIPLLMVTNTPERAADLSEAVIKEAPRQHIDLAHSGPIYITDQKTLDSSVWQTGAWRSVLTGEVVEVGLGEILLKDSKALLDQNPIHAMVPIQIDPKGARPTSALSA